MSLRPFVPLSGPVREALKKAISSGARGTWQDLAQRAGLSPDLHPCANVTLRNLRREGQISSHPVAGEGRVGRPRVVYGPRDDAPGAEGPFDALSYAREVWR